VPSEEDAREIAARFAGEGAREATRFPAGLAHFVYDVLLESGARLVVRLAAGPGVSFEGAAQWSGLLRPMGVPLPALLEAGAHAGRAYLVLERLPGTDLGFVYGSLSAQEKRAIAAGVVDAQRRVGALPEGGGFGYRARPGGRFAWRSWPELLRASLGRSRERMRSAGLFDPDLAGPVERAVARRAALEAVPPRAFLDDTTTKNVLVHAGCLSGIVDVDCVCYGDPLFPVALTRTALLDQEQSLDYVDAWCDLLGLGDEGRSRVSLYTALFCLDFLGEVGHRFNRDAAIGADPRRAARLQAMLEAELGRSGDA
jgi:aminoglycoside phosphotransferase